MRSIIREKTFLKPAVLWAAWLLMTVGIASESVGQSLRFTPLGQWPDYLRMSPGQVAVSGDYAYVTDYSVLKILRIGLIRDDIQLAASVTGNYLVLRWPAGAGTAGFVPESTIRLSSPQWEPVVGEPEVQGGFARLTLPLDAPTRFFRLVQSP